MICAPSVNSWGSADRALGQHAVSLQLHYWFGNMVALFGSQLSVFSSSVLFYADQKNNYFLHQVLLIETTPFSVLFLVHFMGLSPLSVHIISRIWIWMNYE